MRRCFGLCVSFLVLLISCQNATTPVAPGGTETKVTGVALNPASAMVVGGSQTLTATVSPSAATNKALTWKSSDPSVASVAAGVVKAIKAGTTTITVTTVDGSKTATVVVTISAVASAGSTDATLSNLAISQGTLSPAFSASVQTYSVEVENSVTSVTVTATKAQPTATLATPSLTLTNLVEGTAQTATFTVTAADGTTKKTYTVTVTRAKPVDTGAGASAYTAFTSAVDGCWMTTGYTALAVVDGKAVYANGNFPLALGSGNKVYMFLENQWVEFPSYTWNGTGFQYNGSTLTKVVPKSLTKLPASANGVWWNNTQALMSIKDSVMQISPNHPLLVNSAGLVYYYSSEYLTESPYSWNGTLLSYNGSALYKFTEADYPTLPSAADGTWYSGGTSILTVSGSTTTVATMKYTMRFDKTGAIYYYYQNGALEGRAKYPYTWDGKRILVSGGPLTCSTGSDLSAYTYLKETKTGSTVTYTPSGTFSLAVFQASGATSTVTIFDTTTKRVYLFKANTLAPLGTMTWNGSKIVQ